MTTEAILETLVEECHEDHVGLWEIINAMRCNQSAANSLEIRTATVQLVRGLLHERGMQVGQPAPDGRHFVSWNLPLEQAVRRIEREWSALGREPDIGEVAWFTTTDEPRHNQDPQTGLS